MASTTFPSWADKVEAYDAIPNNAASTTRAWCWSINSDSDEEIRHFAKRPPRR